MCTFHANGHAVNIGGTTPQRTALPPHKTQLRARSNDLPRYKSCCVTHSFGGVFSKGRGQQGRDRIEWGAGCSTGWIAAQLGAAVEDTLDNTVADSSARAPKIPTRTNACCTCRIVRLHFAFCVCRSTSPMCEVVQGAHNSVTCSKQRFTSTWVALRNTFV